MNTKQIQMGIPGERIFRKLAIEMCKNCLHSESCGKYFHYVFMHKGNWIVFVFSSFLDSFDIFETISLIKKAIQH